MNGIVTVEERGDTAVVASTGLHARLEDKISALEQASREELVELWIRYHGTTPFKGARRITLVRGIAWQIQARVYGGLKSSNKKRLLKIARAVLGTRAKHSPLSSPVPSVPDTGDHSGTVEPSGPNQQSRSDGQSSAGVQELASGQSKGDGPITAAASPASNNIRQRSNSALALDMVGRKPSTRPGSRLVREWNGRTYEVTVLEKGFSFQGESYRSLSAIAKAITGAHWSGPRFFGVTQ